MMNTKETKNSNPIKQNLNPINGCYLLWENGAMLKNTNKQRKQSHTSWKIKCFPTSPSLDMNVINGSN